MARPVRFELTTCGFEGPLLSAAIAAADRERVFVRRERPAGWREDDSGPIVFVRDERALLARLFAEIVAIDPDVICGWNVVDFDLAVLEARSRVLGVAFAIGRAGERARVLPGATSRRTSIARVPGRVVLDGIATLRSATYAFDRYTLEHVSRELLRRVLGGEPFEPWLAEVARAVQAGERDEELVYRRRLRRELDAYDSGRGAPPHVRAARMREATGDEASSSEIEYVITTRGPSPLAQRLAPIDYGHYLDKQLAPACDVVLPFLGTSFDRIAGTQTRLF